MKTRITRKQTLLNAASDYKDGKITRDQLMDEIEDNVGFSAFWLLIAFLWGAYFWDTVCLFLHQYAK